MPFFIGKHYLCAQNGDTIMPDTELLTAEALDLLRRLIATPRTSRHETAAADILAHFIGTKQYDAQRRQRFALQREANNIWCIAAGYDAARPTLLLNAHIDTVSPSAIINMAHGRLGDYMVDYLLKRNIPLLCPLNVNRLVDDWENDKMGMSGGFLSQSIVMPEIDGAIRPYALFGHYKDEEGMQHVYAIPDRLEKFVSAVNRHIALQQKPNASKRIAIYYYKGPGQNAMTAAGM